jgi:hypothetical protein
MLAFFGSGVDALRDHSEGAFGALEAAGRGVAIENGSTERILRSISPRSEIWASRGGAAGEFQVAAAHFFRNAEPAARSTASARRVTTPPAVRLAAKW